MSKTTFKPVISTDRNITDRNIIAKWKPIIHKPSSKIFIACQKQKEQIIDHYGNKYPFDECEVYPMRYGNHLRECWERAKAIAWQDCPLKVGDIVSPIYGKQAGRKFAIELFDHSDRTIGIATYQYWYPLQYLSFDEKELQSFASTVSESYQKWEAIASSSLP